MPPEQGGISLCGVRPLAFGSLAALPAHVLVNLVPSWHQIYENTFGVIAFRSLWSLIVFFFEKHVLRGLLASALPSERLLSRRLLQNLGLWDSGILGFWDSRILGGRSGFGGSFRGWLGIP